VPVDSTEPETATAEAATDTGREQVSEPGGKTAELRQLAQDAAAYARALGHLALSEAALARVNLVRLLLLALAVPAIVFGILLGFDALLAALALQLFKGWSIAIVCVLVVNATLLVLTLTLLRRWWRSLSLPRSRAALARALEGLK
jgi:hypothetical protein